MRVTEINLLSDSCFILIAPFDIFGRGLYWYTFEEVCQDIFYDKEVAAVRDKMGVLTVGLHVGADAAKNNQSVLSLLQ